jgi:uncharacterized membrane protein required for colicin V production
MAFLLYAYLIVILLACVAMIGLQGIWQSLVTLFNVMMAIVLALNYFEPATTWLDSKMSSYSYLLDILVIWGLFAIFYSVFTFLTNVASKVKVRFLKSVDLVGGIIISLWVAWLLISFTLTSLHTAPLARNSFGGAFQAEPDSRMFMSLVPDRKLLALMHKISTGSFAKSSSADGSDYAFDPEGKFILTYGARRAVFETTRDLRVDRKFGSGIVEEGPQIVD